jgi:hypothetical protein
MHYSKKESLVPAASFAFLRGTKLKSVEKAMNEFETLSALLRMFSDQLGDLDLRFDALEKIMEVENSEMFQIHARKLQDLRVAWQLKRDHTVNYLLSQIETKRKRRFLASHEGKPQ